MEKGYLNEVKAILKSLVLSCTDKMTVDKLNRDYREIEGEYIPYRRLGYGSVDELLRSIPDTLRVFGSGPTAMVCFVANEKSEHIHDMIMTQKKTRQRPRRAKSRGMSQQRNSPVGRGNNRFSSNTQPRKMPGQQFSAFQSTNRNHMTRTIKVWDAPTTDKYPNHRPPPDDNKSFYSNYQLPQPSGISLINTNNTKIISNNVPKEITKVEQKIAQDIKKICKEQMEQKYQEHVKQLTSLMNSSCHVTPTTSLSPQSQAKAVSFSPETKIADQIKPSSQTSNNLNGIKPPKIVSSVQAPKQIKPKKKLSEDIERLISVSSRGSVNPIKETCNHNGDVNNEEPVQSISNKPNDVIKKLFDISDEKVDDLDEAVPEFAANNVVYRLDFPEHTVPYGRKIPPYVLADDVYIGSFMRIFISEIHNPFKFWFHIHKDEHELDYLMYQIERFYKSLDADELRIPMTCLTPGQTCAACYNDLWHRAEIVAPPVNNKIKLSFMDYGTVSEVDINNVKFLASSFSHLPAQALRGCLSHIKPRFLHWSHEATTYFLSLVSELLLYAKITEIDRTNQVLYMVICNTHGEEVIQINKMLVQKSYAFLNENWMDYKIKQNKGQRLHHPREDFPTFSMIESGEYPSFAELVDLEKRGIDYENIYDRIIFNKSAILNKHENAPEAVRKLSYFLMTTNPFRSEIIMELNGMHTETK